jgi:hypothetical protein
MRWKMVVAVLVGSVVVAAACASTNGEHAREGSDGGVLDAIADALGFDHVAADAAAAEKPVVTTVACDKLLGSAPARFWYAEAGFPGRSIADLARGFALKCAAKPDASGYACIQQPMEVKDGAVRVLCAGEGTDPLPSVQIHMPPPF